MIEFDGRCPQGGARMRWKSSGSFSILIPQHDFWEHQTEDFAISAPNTAPRSVTDPHNREFLSGHQSQKPIGCKHPGPGTLSRCPLRCGLRTLLSDSFSARKLQMAGRSGGEKTGDKGREVSTVLEPWHLRLHSEYVLPSEATSQSRDRRRCLGLNGMQQWCSWEWAGATWLPTTCPIFPWIFCFMPQSSSKLGFACPSPLYKYVSRHPSILNNMTVMWLDVADMFICFCHWWCWPAFILLLFLGTLCNRIQWVLQ